jgi:hypothetical protein
MPSPKTLAFVTGGGDAVALCGRELERARKPGPLEFSGADPAVRRKRSANGEGELADDGLEAARSRTVMVSTPVPSAPEQVSGSFVP